MSETQKSRKKRDTSQKRKIILEGAIRVFTEKGFEASSMDKIAEVADVSKRTVYNHFQSKESLFQAIVEDFLRERDDFKPIEYSKNLSLQLQLRKFAEAELYLINDPVRRGLSKLLTSVFLMNVDFGNETRSHFEPHKTFIIWLKAAKEDQKLCFQSPELAARIFYGMVEGCLTWGALFTDGANLKHTDDLMDEIILTFLSRYEC
jgi:TetR/AcrR family transcriptional regulator of autoinduction and epiphytic fitness